MIDVLWLTNHDEIDAIGPWDTHTLRRMFKGERPGHNDHYRSTYENARSVPASLHGKPAVVVLPARHHVSADDIAWLNRELAKLSGVVLVLCGDEEGKFPWREVRHDRIRWWVQMPHVNHYGPMRDWATFFGNGVPDHVHNVSLTALPSADRLAWGFAGQVTHAERKQAANGLLKARAAGVDGLLTESDGFGRGVGSLAYVDMLRSVWNAPAPAGPCHPDTFRFWEAMESGAVPIVRADPYWDMLDEQAWTGYGHTTITDWETVGGAMVEGFFDSAYVQSAWMVEQQRLRTTMRRDCLAIGAPMHGPTGTSIVTTSPSPLHPSTEVIEETLASLPAGVDIFIACDGVRPEQEHLAPRYREYLARLMPIARRHGATPFISHTWRHQANMTRWVLEFVDSPTILFAEHDTPIVGDIPWAILASVVANGHLDLVRLHHESRILPDHEHLMIDKAPRQVLGLRCQRTRQWSQRPHVASTDYYRRILAEFFPHTSRTMIEDRMHSVCQSQPYNRNRLAIFTPEDGTIQRSYHLDARGSEPKFDMRYE